MTPTVRVSAEKMFRNSSRGRNLALSNRLAISRNVHGGDLSITHGKARSLLRNRNAQERDEDSNLGHARSVERREQIGITKTVIRETTSGATSRFFVNGTIS